MKRFERSNGLDTALYKNYLYLFINARVALIFKIIIILLIIFLGFIKSKPC